MSMPPLILATESGFGSLEHEVRLRTDLIRHELRAPLSTLVGVARRRLNSGACMKEVARDLKLIERTALHLLSVIDDTLFAPRGASSGHRANARSRTVTAVSSLHRRDVVSLDELMEDFRECGGLLCETHDNVLQTSLQGSLPNLVSVDAKAVRQVVYNLLTNAARCCREGVISVHMSCVRHKARAYLVVSVTDTGIGLTGEQQACILAGRPLPATGQRKGLGLRVIRDRLAELEGALDVQSRPGQGTSFFVRIPIQVVENAGWAQVDVGEVSRPLSLFPGEAAPPRGLHLPREQMEALADLAEAGEITGVEQWIDRVDMGSAAREHEALGRFVETVRRAAERLDMDMIVQLTRALLKSG